MITPFEARERIRFLDESVQNRTWLHGLNPFAPLIVTLVFIACMVSFDRYALSALIPFAFYPLFSVIVAEIPMKVLITWLTASLPLLIGLGLLNPFLDPATFLFLGIIPVSAGWLSFLSLLGKGVFSISASLCLISVTGLPRLSLALKRLGLPEVLILQLILMGRYITLLLEEGISILSAWRLRSQGQKGLPPAIWGPLMGQWLMRTLDRSHLIFQAMKLRGFSGEYPQPPLSRLNQQDWKYICLWILYFLINRVVNLPQLIGHLLTGGLS